MPPENKKSNTKITKIKPSIFPLGFGVSKIDNSLIIVDFFDVLNEERTILESIVLSKGKAEQLSAALMEAIKHGESED